MAKANGNVPAQTATASGRNVLARWSFTDSKGESHRSPTPDWVTLRCEVMSGERDSEGKPVVHGHRDFHATDYPAEVIHCAFGHGIKQRLGDENARATKDAAESGKASYEVIYENLDNMHELLTSGLWLSESEGGGAAGNLKTLALAIERTLAGTPNAIPEGEAGAERRAALLKKLADDEAWRNGAKKRPDVQVHVKTIEAERAAARLQKAKEAAAAASGEASVLEF